MIPIIFDTDIGSDVDDALALTLAVHSPELDVLAVTTVDGDVHLRGRIARKLLRLLGRGDIPVAAGCGRKLDGKPFTRMPITGNREFLEDEPDGLPLHDQDAVELITNILQASITKITLVLVGPVTNAAMALQRCPQIKEKIERFVIMGGSLSPKEILKHEGWVRWMPDFLKAGLEHNLNADPAASERILKSGIPILLVPAEITFRTYLTESERVQFKQSAAPWSPVLNHMADEFQQAFSKMMLGKPVNRRFAQVYLHDPLTVAALVPQDFMKVEPFHLAPEKQWGVFRTLPQKSLPANALVVTDLDVEPFKHFFAKRVFDVT